MRVLYTRGPVFLTEELVAHSHPTDHTGSPGTGTVPRSRRQCAVASGVHAGVPGLPLRGPGDAWSRCGPSLPAVRTPLAPEGAAHDTC